MARQSADRLKDRIDELEAENEALQDQSDSIQDIIGRRPGGVAEQLLAEAAGVRKLTKTRTGVQGNVLTNAGPQGDIAFDVDRLSGFSGSHQWR